MTNRLAMLSLAAVGGALLAAVPAAAAPERPVRELRCDLLEQNRGRLETVEAPGLRVMEQTAYGLPFAYPVPQGVSGISCGRTSVIPAAWDDKVITAGLPLFIASGTRLGVLEIDNGRFRYRFIEGQAQRDEQARIDERVQQFQSRFDAAQRQATQQ